MPLLLALGVSLAYLLPDHARYGPGFVARLLPLNFLGNIPPMTGLWFLIVIFLGLHRLGRLPLKPESFTTDRSLGLRPFGRLAFWGFAPFALFIAPFTFVSRGVPDIMLNFVMLLVGTALFFLSLLGLRGYLLRAKARHVAWARRLYAQALAPVLDNLESHAGSLRWHRPCVADPERRIAGRRGSGAARRGDPRVALR